ncbi:MAG: DUF4350 domain-containing protein [Actinomycetota bacterium]
MNRRGALFWVAFGLLLLVVAGLTSTDRNETGRPLDPTSTDGLGTRALVELLERFDTEVTFGLPTEDTTAVLLLTDQLGEAERVDLAAWVDDGGWAVVTDLASDLGPERGLAANRRDTLSSGTCTIPSLTGLTLVGGTFLLLDDAGAADTCFDQPLAAYLVVDDVGAGRVVQLGTGVPLTNQYLGEADNAVLVTELLLNLPDGDDRSVAVIYEPVVSGGGQSLLDLVPSSARWTAAQLAVAFGLYAFWRARRFGRPVTEPSPVKLPGSLLVRATGELSRRAHGHGAAHATVRAEHDRRLRERLKLPPELPGPALIDTVASAAEIDPATVARSLEGRPTADKDELLALVAAVDSVTAGLDRVEERQRQGEPT